MNLSLVLAAFCLGIASAVPKFDQNLDTKWYQWKATHRRLYGASEEGWRRAVWEKNMKMIELHNGEYSQGKHGFAMAMNAFGDMTNEEFRQVMGCFRNQKLRKGKLFREPLFLDLPKSVDWRKKGYVTPVKNQKQCGSCWAFSATGALEGQMFRKTGKLVSLSEQNLVDCSHPQGNQGCNGGFMNSAFRYVKENGGLDSEESYPYVAMDGICKYRPENSVANDTGFEVVPAGKEKALMKAVATVGPISVAMDAGHSSFQFYKSGIYFEPDCSSKNLDHGVLVVGYGFEGANSDNNKYWLVKNRTCCPLPCTPPQPGSSLSSLEESTRLVLLGPAWVTHLPQDVEDGQPSHSTWIAT
ncbi:cathepsin L2 isoform X1 [Macaca mulatta]|uniref:Cathepsin V n=2 Tax=Macaca TaxID=9539 RepID=F6U683_MACMU|nr:cathepsin L2 isoform X1 [Macaca mulatta]XP_028691208.1 cathepsin L2 isoform X1 [Macaca mulatta]XP_028691209.1 cathepsin L2 isoform X1 [Macaca mulatta]XP_028691210.1 cathepsin L2 isoform X1 [Macaca mulatta]